MRFIRSALIGLLIALGLSACAVQDGTVEARIEKAQMAIDRGDYAAARAILLDLCPVLTSCDDALLALLAEAQMGLGGVDVLNLIAAVDGLTGSDNTAVFDVFDAMFGTAGVSAQAVADLGDAIATLGTIAAPVAGDQLQLAVAAAAHMAASVLLVTDPDNDGVYDTSGIDSTLAASITNDLLTVAASAAAVDAYLAGSTDVTTSLDGLIADIEGPGGDGVIDTAELTAFVGSL